MSSLPPQASTLRISLPPYSAKDSEGAAPIASISQVVHPPSRPTSAAQNVKNFQFTSPQERIPPYPAVSRSSSISSLNGMKELHVSSRSASPAIGGYIHTQSLAATNNFTASSSSSSLYSIAPASAQEYPLHISSLSASAPPASFATSTSSIPTSISSIPSTSVPVAIPIANLVANNTTTSSSSSLSSSADASSSSLPFQQQRPSAFRRSFTSPSIMRVHPQNSFIYTESRSPLTFSMDESVSMNCDTPITSDYHPSTNNNHNNNNKASYPSPTTTNDQKRHQPKSFVFRNPQIQSFDNRKFVPPSSNRYSSPHKKLFVSSKDPPSIVLDSDPYLPNSAVHQFQIPQQTHVQDLFSMIPITPIYSSPGHSMALDSPVYLQSNKSAIVNCN